MIGGQLRKTGLSFLAAGLCVAAPALAVQESPVGRSLLEPVAGGAVGAAPKSGRLITLDDTRSGAPLLLASEARTVIVPAQPMPPKLDMTEPPAIKPQTDRQAEAVVQPSEADEATVGGTDDPSKAAKMQFDAFIVGLFEFQDAITSGDPSALALQGKVLRRLQINLLSERKLFHQDDAPVEALLIFALSGGDARVSVDLLERVPPTHPLHALGHSVIRYLKGNPDSAFDLVEHNPTEHAFPLSALLALSTGTANARVDAGLARRSLEMATLLGTGTLVEEVALRRLLDIHAEAEDQEAFFAVAESYGMRFPNSIFLNEFARRLSVTLGERNWVPPRGFAPILERISPQQSRVVSREIARGAAIRGNHELALMAVEWLRRNGGSSADDQLYEAMAQLAARNIEEAQKIDDAIAVEILSRRDRLLLASMRRALAHIEGVEPPVSELAPLIATEPVLKAELQPAHRMKLGSLADAKATPVSMSTKTESQADPELVSLRNRLSATLDAIEKLSAQ